MITKTVKEEIECIDAQNKIQDSVFTKEFRILGWKVYSHSYSLKMKVREPKENHVTGFRRNEQ